MRTLYLQITRLALGVAFLMAASPDLWGQACTNTQSGTSCTRSSFFYGETLPNNGCGTFATYTAFGPGEYLRIPVLQGACYTISTCGNTIDTQISAFEGNTTTNPFAFNDDNGPACNGAQASVVMVPNFTDYTRVDIRQFNCQAGGSSSINVQVRQNNNLTITSSSAPMCAGDTRVLTATPAAVPSAQVGSGDLGTFSGTGVSGATFTAPTPAGASQTYTVTFTFGYCSTTQQITVFNAPSPANAGNNATVCSGTATLGATPPSIGTGTWSVISGPGTVTNPSSANSTVTGLSAATPTVLQWTVTNGPCPGSTSQVTITRDPAPTTANAGPDQDVCSPLATLAANAPAVGTGLWTLVGGSGTITTPSSPTSTVTGLGSGTNTFRWSITNGVCNASTDDVVINRDIAPTVASAGADQSICDSTTTMSANAPSVGNGAWTVINGTATAVNPSNPNSALTGIALGTATLTWTISSGACPPSVDTVNVLRNIPPGAASISGNTTICEGAGTQLIASSTAPNPSFLWWDAAAGGNTLAATSAFNTGPLTATDTFWVTVTDGQTGCSSNRQAVTINVLPAPAVDLGPDTSICSNDTLCLDAGPNLNYLWSNSTFMQTLCVTTAGTRWVIVTDSNGCQNEDTIQVSTLSVPAVNLGPDQEFCTGNSIMVGIPSNPNLSYLWSTGDTTSMITATSSGNLSLTATDSNNCSASDDIVVTQLAVPVAGFSVDSSNCPMIMFTDNSMDATSWSWNFGDGSNGSSMQNPSHNYGNSQPGVYNVTLVVTNICGTDTLQLPVDLNCIVGLQPLISDLEVTLYPNPTTGLFKIEFSDLRQDAEVEIFDMGGQMVWRRSIEDPQGGHEQLIDLSDKASGIYMVRMTVGNYQVSKRVVVE